VESEIRKFLTTSETLTRHVDKLKCLCVALRNAADLHAEGSEVAAVFRVVADLIDHRTFSPDWEDLPSLLGKSLEEGTQADFARSPTSPNESRKMRRSACV